MVRRPNVATPEELKIYKTRRKKIKEYVDEYTANIVNNAPGEAAEQSLEHALFNTKDVFESDHSVPLDILLFADCLYSSQSSTCTPNHKLLSFAYIFHEYWNTFDNIFDDDLVTGTEPYVLVANQALNTRVFNKLQLVDSLSYWNDNIIRMTTSFYDELEKSCTAENYLEIVDKQSELFGIITGISARSGGMDESKEVEEFGRMYFKFEQFIRDYVQYRDGHTDPWNAWALMNHKDAVEYITNWQSDILEYIQNMPENQQAVLTPIVGVDISEWSNY